MITTIKNLLTKTILLEQVEITGNTNHITILAVGKIFINMSATKRQQLIYSPLIDLISKKHIHAITINAYSPKEWRKLKTIHPKSKNILKK